MTMHLMAFGALVLWLPFLADPYMAPRLLLVALAAAVALVVKSDRRSSLELPAMAFLAAVVLSAFLGQDWRYSIIGSYQFGMDSILSVVCYCAVLAAASRGGKDAGKVASMVAAWSIPVSLYGIFQRFFKDPLIWQDLHSGTRVASTQGGPIFLGAVLAIASLCALHAALRGDRLARLALALALPALWFTQTRGAMLAFGVGAVFLWRPLALAAIPALVLMPRFLNSSLSDRARIEVWKVAADVFAAHPLTGHGNGTFYIAFRKFVGLGLVDAIGNASYVQSHAHNDVLHVLATMGLVGVAAYAFLAWSALRVALEHPEKKLLLALLACYAVLSSFNPVTTSAFVLLALVFGAASSAPAPAAERRVLPALASLVVALSVGRLCLADYHYARAAAAKGDAALSAMEFQEAARLNPWEMFYACRQVDSLMSLIPRMPGVGDRRALALAGRQLAATAVERHPNDSYAHELYGKQILIAHMAGYRDVEPKTALDAFNRAQELAPTFELLMLRRLNAARVMGELEQVKYATRDLADLQAAKGRKS